MLRSLLTLEAYFGPGVELNPGAGDVTQAGTSAGVASRSRSCTTVRCFVLAYLSRISFSLRDSVDVTRFRM